jgi:3-oxoacyl-[acyl-carrier-protein] synthase II
MQLGITGPNLSVSQFGMSVPSALLTAQRWLVEKRVDRVLCGALDEVSELIGYLWFRRRGGNRETAMLPLRTGTDTDVIGEGAAFFLLSRVEESDTGYCTLEGVSTGSLYRGKPSLPDDAFVLIGADGRQATGVRYRDAVTPETSIGCYTPLYGSMPVGPAFDMAVAALSLRERQRYPAPWHSQSDFPAAAPGARSPLDFPRIACLALGDAGEFGLATLGPL